MQVDGTSLKHFFGKRILIIAPHNDDEVIGCWHFMSSLSHRAHIEIVFATHTKDNRDLIKTRRNESRLALAGLQICGIRYWDIEDGQAAAERNAIISELEGLKDEWDYILCTAPNDRTPDHRTIGSILALHIPLEKLLWYRSTWWTFTPRSADFKVTGDFAGKQLALACFESQRGIALSRSVRFSQIEELVASGNLRSTERFKFASDDNLAIAPLNSISPYHLPRLLFWR